MKNEKNYNASQIQVLEGLEAVRKRPGMYIGSTTQRGLHHLVYEIVDNSVDEALAGYCKNITVKILEDNVISVEDDGRGIPVDIHPKTGLSAAETVYTVLHAGGKFGGDSGYSVSGGLHGVGASVVNALSAYTEVQVKRNEKLYRMKFEKGKTIEHLTEIDKATGTGTKVIFKSDNTIFDTDNYDFDILSNRLREMAFLTRGLRITFEDLRDPKNERKEVYHYEGGIESLVEYLNRAKEKLIEKPIYISNLDKPDEEIPIEIAIQYTTTYSENILSFINNINTPEGGTHVEGFKRALTKAVNDYAKSKGLLKEKEDNLLGDDIREGMTAVISVKVKNPQFEGQTKQKLGNGEVVGAVNSLVLEKLSDFLEENPAVAKKIFEKAKLAAKAREAAKKAREWTRGSKLLESTNLPGKLWDCIEKNAEKSEIFLVEGDSAGGTVKSGRDRHFQAVLPLRGKVLNVEKAGEHKVLGNESLKPIIQSIGGGIGKTFDINKIRYGKIVIMADADVDGAHIRTLLLTFFFRHMRPLIENGYVYLAQPPLFKVSKRGMEDIYCYTEKHLEEVLSAIPDRENVKLQRYKGLGEMNADQLWDTTINPETRTLIKVTLEDASYADQIFSTLMGDEVQPRREFIEKYANTVVNLDI